MPRFKVGVQLHPQATTTADLRAAWREADGLGVDSIWVWDHFFPLYADPDAAHFECYALLAAMAVETEKQKPADVAKKWVDENEAIWKPWVEQAMH